DWFFKNLACNILMFMPFGFLPPLFMKRNKVWQILIYGIIASFLIEVLQVLLAVGTGDIDDIILNAFGTLIGFGIYKLIYSVALKNSLD
ncbi:MAG: VanZ family protein, partial [Eubacterium sp.]|nr:VanZ family protein [Eubacterium sp.]